MVKNKFGFWYLQTRMSEWWDAKMDAVIAYNQSVCRCSVWLNFWPVCSEFYSYLVTHDWLASGSDPSLPPMPSHALLRSIGIWGTKMTICFSTAIGSSSTFLLCSDIPLFFHRNAFAFESNVSASKTNEQNQCPGVWRLGEKSSRKLFRHGIDRIIGATSNVK